MSLRPSFSFLGILLSAVVASQSIDSLKKELANSKAENLVLTSAEVMNQLGNRYRSVNIDSSEYWLEQSLDAAKNILNKKLIAKNLFDLGEINYEYKGDLELSLNYFNQSILIYKELLDLEKITLTNFNIGKVSLDQGNFMMASEFLVKSLTQYEELEDSVGMARVNNSLGIWFSKQQDFSQALVSHRRALAYETQLGLTASMGINYNNIGLTYKKMGYYDSALFFYKKGLEIEETIDFPLLRGSFYDNMGNVYELLGELDSAILFHEKSIAIAEELGHMTLKGWANKGLASAHYELTNYKTALSYAKKAKATADEVGEKDMLRQSAEILHKTYYQLSDFEAAYQYLLLFKSVGDSLFNAETIKQSASLQQEYLYEKNNQIQKLELQAQEAYFLRQINREKTIVYLLIACGSVILLFLVIIYRNYRIKRRVSIVLQEKNQIISNQAVKKVLATKSRTFFDYILMDLDMPILDGFETSIELKRYGFKNPILSFSSNEDLKRLEKKPLIDYSLQKPIVREEFMNIVRAREAAKKREAIY